MGIIKDIIDTGKDLWYAVKKPVPKSNNPAPSQPATNAGFEWSISSGNTPTSSNSNLIMVVLFMAIIAMIFKSNN